MLSLHEAISLVIELRSVKQCVIEVFKKSGESCIVTQLLDTLNTVTQFLFRMTKFKGTLSKSKSIGCPSSARSSENVERVTNAVEVSPQ